MATNIDIVRTGCGSFRRGDVQTTRAMFAEDIEWREPRWPAGRVFCLFRGRDQVVRRIFAPLPGVDDAAALEAREFYGDRDTVIVTGVFRVTLDGGDRPSEVPFAHVWTVHDGLIDSLRAYNDVGVLATRNARDAT
jgi:ketosteroid isomerase-like protein